MSDMAGKAAEGSGRAQRGLPRYNGATGMSDMAGKAAEGSGRAQRGLPRYKEDQLPWDVGKAFTSAQLPRDVDEVFTSSTEFYFGLGFHRLGAVAVESV
jgi:hypothetical protein